MIIMPFRKKSTTHRKKYSRRTGGRKSLSLYRSPVPQKMVTKLRYADTFDLNPSAVSQAVASHIFSANGLYDPNITGVGHQCRGFDQLMTLYDHYVVLGAKATFTFDNSGNEDSMYCGIALRDSSTSIGTLNSCRESGSVRQTITPGTGSRPTVISYKLNPSKFLGRSRAMSDPELKGSDSANPTEQCYFHAFCAKTDQVSGLDPIAVHCGVVIDYIVALIEPKQPAQS